MPDRARGGRPPVSVTGAHRAHGGVQPVTSPTFLETMLSGLKRAPKLVAAIFQRCLGHTARDVTRQG